MTTIKSSAKVNTTNRHCGNSINRREVTSSKHYLNSFINNQKKEPNALFGNILKENVCSTDEPFPNQINYHMNPLYKSWKIKTLPSIKIALNSLSNKKKDGRTDQSLPKSPSKEGAACFLFGMSYYCNLNNWTSERPTNRTMNRTSRHKKSVIGDDGGKKSHNKQLWAKRHHSYRFYKPHVNSFPLSLPPSPSKQTYFSFCLKWSLLFCSFYNLKLSLSLSIFLLNLDKSPAKISAFFFFRPGEEKKLQTITH